MHLQSLEMIGFKSFAPKTVLHFNEGVTAVVGPNGCGKSNVLDALRWVLGEQSAKALRGGEMADVIFSGTDSRQALGMAEVSLTFADCEKELGVEWNEVRITRRVFRDGKSEYLLNKAPCRLKDIHQLFMDTGIGRSAYSIMEQGKIDAILSSRPEDRRAIFEEAAGITKYKAQKKEALRKLEYTEANLLRVSDIIKEVKRQIGSLQRQAGKARRYQALVDELRTFDTHLSHRNFTNFRAELSDVKAQLGSQEEARATHESEIEQRESELGGYRANLGEIERNLTVVRDEIQSQRNSIYAAETRIASNAERVGETRDLIERNRLEIASCEEKRREQENQIARTDAMIAEMLEILRAGESQLSEANERLRGVREDRVKEEQAAQALHSEIGQIEARLSTLRRDVSAAAGRREAGEARLQVLRNEEASASESLSATEARAAESRSRIESATAELASVQTESDEAQMAADDAQRVRQQVEAELNAAMRTLTEQESKIEVLRQLTESGEGFGEGAQAVLRGLDNPEFFKPAVHGALASLIEVDSQYIPAIEAALGANLQAIIFKDPAVAESALATLSGKKLGRAAVVPRDWLAPEASNISQSLPEGALAWAEDCVRIADPSGVLAKQLLAGIAVVEQAETAFALKAQHRTLGFVTLGGEFISREGIVHGGSGGDGSGSVLARKNQMLALEHDIAASSAIVAGLQARRSEAVSILDLAHDRLRSVREAVQAAQVADSTARSEGAMIERQLAEAGRRRDTLASEAATLEQTVVEATSRAAEFETGVKSLEESLQAARSRQGEAQAHNETARDRERLATDELNE
ncbi:MAG: chromosome segregation protein SMC, partial [Chthoniobacterales bacterium]